VWTKNVFPPFPLKGEYTTFNLNGFKVNPQKFLKKVKGKKGTFPGEEKNRGSPGKNSWEKKNFSSPNGGNPEWWKTSVKNPPRKKAPELRINPKKEPNK